MIEADLFAQPWAMESEALKALASKLASLPADQVATAMRERPGSRQASAKSSVKGTVATVNVQGVLMRSVPAWYSFFGIEATETGAVQDEVEKFASDPSVSSIVLSINSPGGDAQGIGECADAIREASKKKSVVAVVDGMACSAAYWLASQASRISAAPDAFVGSIGVYQVAVDSSKAAADKGYKVHVIRSGEHKGMGTGGAPITASQIAATQELIDGLASLFVKAVARGRKHAITKGDARDLATGQVFLASTAKENGLVDDIESPARAKERVSMDDKEKAEALAKAQSDAVATERKRAADIRAAFPGHPTFAMEQIEAGASLSDAKAAFATVLASELAEERKASAAAKAELEAAKKSAPKPFSVPAVAAPAPRGGDPSATSGEGSDFIALALEYAAAHKCSKTEAMRMVAAYGKALEDGRARPTSDPVLKKITPAIHAEWVDSQPKVSRGRSYRRVVRPGAASDSQ